MTALVAISDQSTVSDWGWRGWTAWLLFVGAILVVSARREHVRRQNRKKQGRA